MEYLRGSCKPSNDLPLWTDSIWLCKLQKQHRAWHKEDRKLALNQERIWTSVLDHRSCPSVATESFFELHSNPDRPGSFIMWCLVLSLIVRWNPSEESLCFLLGLIPCFLNSIKIPFDQPRCGRNPPSASAIIPNVISYLHYLLLPCLLFFFFSRAFTVL